MPTEPEKLTTDWTNTAEPLRGDPYPAAAPKAQPEAARGDVDERMYNATIGYYSLSLALALGGFVWCLWTRR